MRARSEPRASSTKDASDLRVGHYAERWILGFRNLLPIPGISQVSVTMRAAIVDTGPLVAFLDRAEQHHCWVPERIEDLDTPLLVCASRGDAICSRF
jgi:hypothetical protein